MRYIVENEKMLGYVTREPEGNKPVSMVVMAVDVEKGGDSLLIDRTTIACHWRYATREDEDRFGVRLFSDTKDGDKD